MTATGTRVFIARLAGYPVFDPNGDKVGAVRDVVCLLRVAPDPPRVLGLVVEIQRRRVFVPMARVTSLDVGGAVLASGMLNLRRFDQRPTETLVLEQLLDRKVALVETGETVVVVDVAMETTRTGDWLLRRVAIRRVGGVRRRGAALQLDWDAVTGFAVAEHSQGAANLLAAFERMRPADLAVVLHDLPVKRRLEVVAALDDETLALVLEELPEDDQVGIVTVLADDRAADVLEAMAPDDAADLLGDLPDADARRLLEMMEPDEAADVRRLLIYPDDSAGGLMTSEPVVLGPDATVAEALARVRNPELSPTLAAQVYVCRPPTETPTGRFLGVAHIQRLLREPPSSLVSGCADTDLDPIQPDATVAEVTRRLATYDLVAVPVVDSQQRLLGAVTVDDVLDHLLPEDWRTGSTRPPSVLRRSRAGG